MTVPAALQGVWVRTSVQVGEGEVFESHHVHWVQAGTAYADLRTSFVADGAPSTGFAGTCTWADPWASWTHELDLGASIGVDRGRLRWLPDGTLEERGDWTTDEGPVPYVERWHAVPGPDRPVLALRCDDPPGRLVRVGDHAIVIWDERPVGGAACGQHLVRAGGHWVVEHAVGDGRLLHAAPAVGDDEVVGHEGIDWQVVERRL
ncbi:hypothetical protein B7486_68095 [cyanobacterium TDX16]|nr:hypothetical protein B7486_68095 [cyanobacterium TDX16]